MSNAILGYGVKLQREYPTGSGTYADIAEVINLGGPSLAVDAVEVTHAQSAEAVREFIAGLADAGEIQLTVNTLLTDPSQNLTGILRDYNTQPRPVRNYKILFPPTTAPVTWSGPGILTGYAPSVPIDDRMTTAITIKCAGKWTLA